MRTVLYLRLSDEDRNKLSKEKISESIKNQEKLLRNYAIENNWNIIGVYQDEDYSGSDRDRPNFNKMISECKKGNVDIVLVKSQARFARDIELIDKYVHNLFYEWNVRFMTYLEKIDNSKKETKKTSQIISMVDEWYIEDTSINIRETLKMKRENGEFTGSFAPYGYKKDPFNKNHLVIDYEVANIIKRIYKEYSNGIGIQSIAKKLNKENILSPLEYKRLNGSKLQIPIVKENYKAIQQSGYYKIDIMYSPQNKKNIIIYHHFSNNDKALQITLTKTNNVDIYYTINNKKSIKINCGETLPSHYTSIISYIKDLNIPTSYQFEVFLKKNTQHKEYSISLNHYHNYTKINLDYQLKIRKKYKWSPQTIKKILTNEIYIGNLLQFKSTHISYKNHTVIQNSPNKWIKVLNTHDAIIDKELWYNVQNKLNNKKRSDKKGIIHPLSNKLFCSYCHKPFIKCGKKNKDGFSYLCCKDKKEKWNNCINKKYLKELDIHLFLLNKINNLIDNYYDSNILKDLEKKDPNFEKEQDIEKQLLLKKLEEKEKYFINLYESNIKKELTNQEFILLKEKYEKDIENIKLNLANIYKERKIAKFCHSKLKFKQLNSLFVNLFIDKIYIGTYDKKTNSREIKIIWNFL